MTGDEPPAPATEPARERAGQPPVQHCPFCGESIGSFWARRSEEGEHWCEACGAFFRVELRE